MSIIPNNKGSILFQVLIFAAIAFAFVGALVTWTASNIKFTNHFYHREVALGVAEAGVEYYRWHLAHDPDDFQDGTQDAGPYVHVYYDAAGNRIGEFSLEITPPDAGSNVAIISSTGTIDASSFVSRTIEATLAQPSLASYAVIGNTDLYFAENVNVTGNIHANGGVRFDGYVTNLVTSALSSYDDPSHAGDNELAVHTHVTPLDPLPPEDPPTRLDVFGGGRDFPVPAFDFDGIMADLSNIKANAQSDGVYLPNSGALGYHLDLKTDDTIDVYKVNALTPVPSVDCEDEFAQDDWGTWSILSEVFDQNVSIPTNGAIFVEDDAWVDGQITTAKLTIGAARFPENPTTYANITINDNLLYSNYDGADIIGLIAQNNINLGLDSGDNMRIDAALVAKNGRVGRYYYSVSDCSPYGTRDSLTLYGLIASNGVYGVRYSDGSGYQTRVITYDGNLLYNSPPFFPSVDSIYNIIKWREF